MIADLCLKPQTHAGVRGLFMFLSTCRSALAFTPKTTFSNQQQHVASSPHSFILTVFPSPFFLYIPPKALTFPNVLFFTSTFQLPHPYALVLQVIMSERMA